MADELSPEAFGNSGGMWQAQGLWLGQVNTWGAQWLWESPATSLNQPWEKSAAQDHFEVIYCFSTIVYSFCLGLATA